MGRVGNRIKTLRVLQGLSLQKFADAVGTSKSQIDKLEKGDRRLTVEWMVRLAKPLGCDPRDLLPPQILHEMIADTPLPVRYFSQDRRLRNLKKNPPPVQPTDKDAPPVSLDVTIERPFFLRDCALGFALVVSGRTIPFLYQFGQILFLHPRRHPQSGKGIVVMYSDGTGGIYAYEKETPSRLYVLGGDPIDKKDIVGFYSVIGMWEPENPALFAIPQS